MNVNEIIIILVATLIVLLLTAIVIFIILKNRTNNQRSKFQKIIKDAFQNISLEVVEAMFKRIDTIARNNSKYKDKCSVFEDKLDNIYKKETVLKNDAQEFLATIDKINKDDRNSFILEFKEKTSILNQIIKEFIDQANITLKAEQFLRKEANYYQERYKMVTNFYQQIATKIEIIANELTNLNNEIIELNKKFDEAFSAGEVSECTLTLGKYREKILLFAYILDEAPIIGDIIYNQIPLAVNKLVDHFKNTRDNLKSDLNYINFTSTLGQIRDRFIHLKKCYEKMDMAQSKNQIIWIFKNIKSLEALINNEIRSKKSVLIYYDSFKNKTAEVLTNYVTIRKQIKILIKINQVGNDEQKMLEQMNSVATEINDNAILLTDNLNDKMIPFTSKKLKMKRVFELELSLVEIMNELLIQISHARNFKLNFSNRLKYVSAITTNLYSKINILKMQLTEKEMQRLDDLDQKLLNIEKMILVKNIDYDLVNHKFLDIENRLISISKIIGGKKEAAIITKNLIAYFAPKRKLDKVFNQKINSAEKLYLSGKYIESLNTIISGIEMVK